jgi:hypothetical protein
MREETCQSWALRDAYKAVPASFLMDVDTQWNVTKAADEAVQDTFKATRDNLHPIAAKMVAVDLGV